VPFVAWAMTLDSSRKIIGFGLTLKTPQSQTDFNIDPLSVIIPAIILVDRGRNGKSDPFSRVRWTRGFDV